MKISKINRSLLLSFDESFLLIKQRESAVRCVFSNCKWHTIIRNLSQSVKF
jgi:hypothetical protein